MIFILIGMLQCSKLSYDFYNSKHYQFSPRLGQESSKSGPSVYVKKEKKKCVARGQEVNFTKNTLNELSKYYTNADMNIIS